MALLLRVIISSTEARRVQLSEVPKSVDSLISILQEKLQLQGQFFLQFEDPDFGNALCNLSEISELPSERAVLHIQWSRSSLHETNSLSSISSLDTASLDNSEASSHSPTVSGQRYLRTASEWPLPFPIPTLSFDVELKLRRGNETWEKTKIGIDVTRDLKIEVLDKIVQAVFDIKAYPDNQEIESIASALISKYPCLKEPGKGKGYEGWLISIKNKLNNYRAKLRVAGCNEVSVNRKRKDDGNVFTLKKAKHGEVNHVPEHPCNHTDTSLEEQRLLLVEETKKARRNIAAISEKMELTFSLRRKEVVQEQPMIVEVQERWPALFYQEQICEEFFRITNKDLLGVFMTAIDMYTLKLLKLYRARKGAFGQDMDALLDRLDERTTDIVNHRRTAALEGLPVFLRENPTELFKKCKETEDGTKGVSVGILYVLEDNTQTTSPMI
ncbi:uncharacterized protein LOC127617417 [Xyrauchen texanus]|uniref:uncharacterized protein LOC127617417 n=1 Tax=Xyrauchen texanus TaxID=154827 RepID=UPI002242C395|nr:uncharacterized protein LOC127617417 [Xyrauchen texanus]